LEPTPADVDSRKIAQRIIGELRDEMEQGNLRGFSVDVKVDDGVVWLKGRVASRAQKALALDIARNACGVKTVVDDLKIRADAPPVRTAEFELTPEKLLTATNREEADGADDGQDADELANEVARRLRKQKDLGRLKGFGVDVTVNDAVVWLSGHVANREQMQLVLDQARYVPGVKQVVNDLRIGTSNVAATSGAAVVAPSTYSPPAMLNPGMGSGGQMPLAFAPARPANYQIPPGSSYQPGTPMPMANPGVGIAPARFDHPMMPGYAWPSYASYPNYGAVTYPRQHSASAWPYIGPFYPYPQVPLGWRKVTLEWDDGWWMLDFKNRH
jgi:osmotically-inducible protein OsmY